MKQILLSVIIICLVTLSLFSGDIATFVNLGFSGDSRYFMFSQYGLTETTAAPYAELYIVDVKSNIFAPYGEKALSYKQSVEPGNSGVGVLFNIIEENIALKTKYDINHLSTGRILYHLLNGAKNEDPITFRDFISNQNYKVVIRQKSEGKGKNVESSFSLELTITKSSKASKTFNIGHPSYKRKGVKSYKIKQIIVAPDEKSLVIVIEKEEADTTGVNIRYMVETVKVDF
ncbi:MAG: DUF2259 domain-containing protein [Spirochaetales bacterium]|nr:DUF2259 domain-containing protein [Spirochaetales bacterium]